MATVQGQQRRASAPTPQQYADWYYDERTPDEAIEGQPHPDDYAAEYAEQQRTRARPQAGTTGVRSPKSEVRSAPAAKSGSVWALALALLAFGAIAWVFGGVFTLDGWVTWLNSFFGIVRLPFVVPTPVGLGRLLFIPLAIAYSRIEVKHQPVWQDKVGKWHIEKPLYWVGFALIALTDIGSTSVGLQGVNPAQWGALQPTVTWIIANGWRAGATATVLTFAPEWLMLSAIWLLKK